MCCKKKEDKERTRTKYFFQTDHNDESKTNENDYTYLCPSIIVVVRIEKRRNCGLKEKRIIVELVGDVCGVRITGVHVCERAFVSYEMNL